tara:strand:+ start:300 stop:530 length:231 start_codon:yes stop_codon:yes gene_type:complete
MATKMWTKKETQKTIKDLRAAGYNIQKSNGIYKIVERYGDTWMKDDKPLFSAMIGMGGYLVKYHEDLFNSITIKGD